MRCLEVLFAAIICLVDCSQGSPEKTKRKAHVISHRPILKAENYKLVGVGLLIVINKRSLAILYHPGALNTPPRAYLLKYFLGPVRGVTKKALPPLLVFGKWQ